jgi:hypothetical protein
VPKYRIQPAPMDSYKDFRMAQDRPIHLLKDGWIIAVFTGDGFNNQTNAQKVCDLLNETSRSQGKFEPIDTRLE